MCLCPLLNCYFSSELFFYEDPFFPQGWSSIPPTELNFPYHTSHSTHPSVLQAKDSILTPRGTDTAVGLAVCHVMHTLKQNKEVYTKYQTGKKKNPKDLCQAQAARTLYLCKEMIWTQGLFSCNHCFCCSATQLCPTLCNPLDCSIPDFPILFCSNSCPLSRWSHPTISSSSPPSFSSGPQYVTMQGLKRLLVGTCLLQHGFYGLRHDTHRKQSHSSHGMKSASWQYILSGIFVQDSRGF